MVPSDRFKPVQRVTENRERKAASALGERLKTKQAAEKQLQDLRIYHAEYLSRYQQAKERGVHVSQVREFQVFLDKLEQAIAEQEKRVAQAAAACADAQATWRDKYTRSQVIDNVLERMKADEQRQADKREQARQDDRPRRPTES